MRPLRIPLMELKYVPIKLRQGASFLLDGWYLWDVASLQLMPLLTRYASKRLCWDACEKLGRRK